MERETYTQQVIRKMNGTPTNRTILRSENLGNVGWQHTLTCGHKVTLDVQLSGWTTRLACPICLDPQAARDVAAPKES